MLYMLTHVPIFFFVAAPGDHNTTGLSTDLRVLIGANRSDRISSGNGLHGVESYGGDIRGTGPSPGGIPQKRG